MKRANYILLAFVLLIFSGSKIDNKFSNILASTRRNSIDADVDYPPNPAFKKGWRLTFHDEFDGSVLNLNLWIPYYFRHRFSDSGSRASYILKEGLLYLTVNDIQANNISSLQTIEKVDLHKNGIRRNIPTTTKFVQKYGYFEIRAKTQEGSGHNSAFWLVGQQNDDSQSAEIDILEHPAGRGSSIFLSNVHSWKDVKLKKSIQKSPIKGQRRHEVGRDLSATFNIYSLEWSRSNLRFYFNNKLISELPYAPDYPMGLLLSLYEGNSWWGKLDSTISYPKSFIIDYVRVYEKR